MSFYFDGEFNGIKRWGESQYLDEEKNIGHGLFSFPESQDLDQDPFFEDCHNDDLGQKTSDNNIESYQNLSKKKLLTNLKKKKKEIIRMMKNQILKYQK